MIKNHTTYDSLEHYTQKNSIRINANKDNKWDDHHVCLLITNNASKIPLFHFKMQRIILLYTMAVIFGSLSPKCRHTIKSNIIWAKICHRINANLIPCIHICSTASPQSQENLKLHTSNVFLSAIIWYIILVSAMYNLLFDWTWHHPPSLRKISLTTIPVNR